MTERVVRARFLADTRQYIADVGKAKDATVEFGRAITGHGKASRADIEQIGKTASIMAIGVVGSLGLAAKAAIDWESSWAGVSKTVDGSASEMADLEQGLRSLATELPATHAEIAAVAEAAGQLGIQRGAIEGFTRTMIDLGETTNLTADQAATSLARMANIMQTPQQDIERMASTLVALGNAGASTESEILDMALRISGAAKQVGITEAATLGFANALSSVGIEAEAGGTAISTVFSKIASAVADGGASMDEFARISGMSSSQFKTAFEEDAAGATVAFIEGLNGIKASGENVFAVLGDLELGDIRVRDALLRASGAGDLFRESLALGAEEWERNNALQTEAQKRYDTTAAKMEVARNQIVDLGIDVGGVLLPAVSGAAGAVSALARGFGEMPGPVQTTATGLGAVTAAGLGVVGLVGVLGPKVEVAREALMKMGGGGQFVARNMGSLAAGLGFAGAAMTVYSLYLGENAKKQAEAETAAQAYTDAINEQGRAVGDMTDELALTNILEGELGETLREAGADLDVFTSSLRDAPSGVEDLSDAFAALSGADDLEAMEIALEQVGVAGSSLGDELLRLAESGDLSTGQLIALTDRLGEEAEAHARGAREAENQATAQETVGATAASAADGVYGLTEELGMNEEAAKAAETALKNLMDSYRAAVDPLFGVLDALDGNRSAQQALSEAIAANTDLIDDNNVSAEEMNSLYADVAKSALDVNSATQALAAAVDNGTVSVDQATAMLHEWVAQGLITEDQAANVAFQFGVAAHQAEEFSGDYVASIYVQGADDAIEKASRLAWEYSRIPRTITTTFNGVEVTRPDRTSSNSQGGLIPQHLAIGGTAGHPGHPSGTDTIPAWLTPGEFVMRKSSVDRIGVPMLDALNRGHLGSLGGGPVDNSRHVGQLVVQTSAPPRAWIDEFLWQGAGL